MASEEESKKEYNARALLKLFGIFAVISLFSLYGFTNSDDTNWEPTTCRIVTSTQETPYKGKRNWYSAISITYHYEFQGKHYTSSRIDSYGLTLNRPGAPDTPRNVKYALDGSTVPLVRLHPAGNTATCYVNPRRPELAVLCKGTSLVLLYLSILFSVLAAGALTVFLAKNHRPRRVLR